MFHRFLVGFSLLLTSLTSLTLMSCTVSEQHGELQASTHMPLVSKHWERKITNDQCSISSGHNGIIVDVIQTEKHGIQQLVSSTRRVRPGVTFVVRTGSKEYRSFDDEFDLVTSKRVIQALLSHEKAYFEWLQSDSNGKQNTYNTINLVEFKQAYEACKASLKF